MHKKGFMCQIDFDHELSYVQGGTKIYPTLQDARDNLKCADTCGIYEVKISIKRVALKGTD